MKVIGIAGSPRKGGNSEAMVKMVLKGAEKKGAQTKLINLAGLNIGGCKACMYCRSHEGCAQKDDMQKIYQEINSADGVVIGFPIYMFTMNAQTKAFVDRLFPYLGSDYKAKVNKKTVLVVAQGQADTSVFVKNLDWAKNSLGFLGFPVIKMIIEGNGNEPGAFSKRNDLIKTAESAGAELVG
jgi:multimeric flavodoxin WrbA